MLFPVNCIVKDLIDSYSKIYFIDVDVVVVSIRNSCYFFVVREVGSEDLLDFALGFVYFCSVRQRKIVDLTYLH